MQAGDCAVMKNGFTGVHAGLVQPFIQQHADQRFGEVDLMHLDKLPGTRLRQRFQHAIHLGDTSTPASNPRKEIARGSTDLASGFRSLCVPADVPDLR